MTKLQREIIERIKVHDGIVSVSAYGMYTRFGTYLAFASNAQNSQQFNAARNTFLEKFCVPFTKEETQKVCELKKRHLSRYKQLIMKAAKQNKFESAKKLSENAQYLYEIIHEENFRNQNYYRLKEGL